MPRSSEDWIPVGRGTPLQLCHSQPFAETAASIGRLKPLGQPKVVR
jgi:hypothetical protein